ncbi:BA75_04716T0 [Komagataella pastoris]|uniref:BA75_04716T0 n=1 Tax=Komagataella pastoris TaxID=4922 RepID=A0A1B2JH63_PICPA|nr:BA75_04716T0 [Komagataella pastoris]
MPINTLESHLFDNHSVNTYPFDVLKNATVGIDVEHYISRLLSFKKELNYDAISGVPLTLLNYIDTDLKMFQELNIRPLFVFPGLKSTSQFEKLLNGKELNSSEIYHRKVWDDRTYSRDGGYSFREPWSSIPIRPLYGDLITFFIENNIDYLVAPYSAVVQLHYLESKQMVDVVYSSTDYLLLNPTQKFILGFEFQNREFKSLDKTNILSRLSLSFEQLKNISFALGNEFQPERLPGFLSASFPSLHDYVNNGGSIINSLLQDPASLEKFQRGLALLKYAPVLKEDGSVGPLNSELFQASHPSSSKPPNIAQSANSSSQSTPSSVNTSLYQKDQDLQIPNDLHDVIGQRLPNELYFYISLGLINFELLESIIYDHYLERLPLDAQVTPLYEKITIGDDSIELKGKVLNVLTSFLNRYYQVKRLQLTAVYQPIRELSLNQRIQPTIYSKIRSIIVKTNQANGTVFSLDGFFKSFSSKFVADSVITDYPNDSQKISQPIDIVSTGLLRALTILGFVDYSFALTKWGELLVSPFFQQTKHPKELFLLLVLFKLGKITERDLIEPSDSKANSDERKSITLISKISGLLKLKTRPINYNSKVSRSVLNFRSTVSKINTIVSEALNSSLISLFLSAAELKSSVRLNDTDYWRQIVKQTPFRTSVPNTLLGVATLTFLTTYINAKEDSPEKGTEPLEKANTFIEQTFSPVSESPKAQVVEGFEFFKEVCSVVKLLEDSKLIGDKSLLQRFESSQKLIDQIQ